MCSLVRRRKDDHDPVGFHPSDQMGHRAVPEAPPPPKFACGRRRIEGQAEAGLDLPASEAGQVDGRELDPLLQGVRQFPDLFGEGEGALALCLGRAAQSAEVRHRGVEPVAGPAGDEEGHGYVKRGGEPGEEVRPRLRHARLVLPHRSRRHAEVLGHILLGHPRQPSRLGEARGVEGVVDGARSCTAVGRAGEQGLFSLHRPRWPVVRSGPARSWGTSRFSSTSGLANSRARAARPHRS